jgi:Zn-dependent metalloprotease
MEDIMGSHGPLHCILPPEILRKLAGHEQAHVRRAALETLALDTRFRLARAEAAAARRGAARPVTFARIGGSPQRMIYDQDHGTSQTPGQMVRGEGQDATSDPSVNQAYDGLGATYQYYWTRYMRDSIDGQGMPLLGCVHFGSNYDNAFWDNAGHMFFGDGDGVLLTDTTAGIDVIGHELTHGVTQHEANLEYSG